MIQDEKTMAIVEKIRKLLAVANGTANEHEASVAASKAQDLLEAYNLDMAIISQKSHSAASPRNRTHRAGGLYKWQRNLWYAVSTLNFCVYYYKRGLRSGEQYEHQIIGSHANVIGTEIMAQYLEQAIERLTRNWVKVNHPNKSVFIRDAIAYREGLATRISGRLWSQRNQHLAKEAANRKEERARNAAKGINTENALVLQDVINTEEDLNNDFIHGLEPGTSARRRAANEAYRAKAEAAAMEILRKQDEWDAAHPEEAKRRKAAEARRNEEEWKRYRDRENRRAKTPEEKRQELPSWHEGYVEGEKVSLNRQVDQKHQRKIT